ncbi:MAG: hypothetical protein ABI353_13155, partial [Isosphaeraceae bacterium]
AANVRLEAANDKQARIQKLAHSTAVEVKILIAAFAEVRDREADRDIAQAEMHETEVRLRQAERRLEHSKHQAAQPGPEEASKVKLSKIRRDAKEAALRGAAARIEAAKAELERFTMLAKRGAGLVSKSEIDKAEAEVHNREAQRDIARAELQEAELVVEEAERPVAHPDSETSQPFFQLDHPERLRPFRVKSPDSVALERRLNDMDLKLDRILKALETLNTAH